MTYYVELFFDYIRELTAETPEEDKIMTEFLKFHPVYEERLKTAKSPNRDFPLHLFAVVEKESFEKTAGDVTPCVWMTAEEASVYNLEHFFPISKFYEDFKRHYKNSKENGTEHDAYRLWEPRLQNDDYVLLRIVLDDDSRICETHGKKLTLNPPLNKTRDDFKTFSVTSLFQKD